MMGSERKHGAGRGRTGPTGAAVPRFSIGLALGLALIAGSCTVRRERMLVGEIAQGIQTNPAHVEMARLYPAAWDRVCVVPPRTDAATARALLGFDYRRAGSLEKRNDVTGLWFVRGDKVTTAVNFPRRQGDFAAVGRAYCLPRDRAFFRADLTPAGGARVVPIDSV